MAARSRCGQARIQPVSHFSRAATERATTPIADDVGLVMSELSFPRFGSISPKVHPRSFSYLPAGSPCRQKYPSSLRISGRQQ
jgi:hypothetical protein